MRQTLRPAVKESLLKVTTQVFDHSRLVLGLDALRDDLNRLLSRKVNDTPHQVLFDLPPFDGPGQRHVDLYEFWLKLSH